MARGTTIRKNSKHGTFFATVNGKDEERPFSYSMSARMVDGTADAAFIGPLILQHPAGPIELGGPEDAQELFEVLAEYINDAKGRTVTPDGSPTAAPEAEAEDGEND